MYVIYKNSRIPTTVSYNGPTWDQAGIRYYYKAQYESKVAADAMRDKFRYPDMSCVNNSLGIVIPIK